METPEQYVSDAVPVFLLSTLNIFHTYFTHCPGISIVDLEQVSADWAEKQQQNLEIVQS